MCFPAGLGGRVRERKKKRKDEEEGLVVCLFAWMGRRGEVSAYVDR